MNYIKKSQKTDRGNAAAIAIAMKWIAINVIYDVAAGWAGEAEHNVVFYL